MQRSQSKKGVRHLFRGVTFFRGSAGDRVTRPGGMGASASRQFPTQRWEQGCDRIALRESVGHFPALHGDAVARAEAKTKRVRPSFRRPVRNGKDAAWSFFVERHLGEMLDGKTTRTGQPLSGPRGTRRLMFCVWTEVVSTRLIAAYPSGLAGNRALCRALRGCTPLDAGAGRAACRRRPGSSTRSSARIRRRGSRG